MASAWSNITAMQEFSSVTASSYDADSLTPLLNAKASEGWTVVTIVSAGTNIVAYLSRDTDELDMIEEAEVELAVEEAIIEEAAVEVAEEEALVEEVAAAEVAAAEPAGWAVAPESETPGATDDSRRARRPGQLRSDARDRRCRAVSRPPPPHRLRPPSPQCPPAGTPTRRPGTSCATGTARMDRARVARRPAVHRPARRLSPAASPEPWPCGPAASA